MTISVLALSSSARTATATYNQARGVSSLLQAQAQIKRDITEPSRRLRLNSAMNTSGDTGTMIEVNGELVNEYVPSY